MNKNELREIKGQLLSLETKGVCSYIHGGGIMDVQRYTENPDEGEEFIFCDASPYLNGGAVKIKNIFYTIFLEGVRKNPYIPSEVDGLPGHEIDWVPITEDEEESVLQGEDKTPHEAEIFPIPACWIGKNIRRELELIGYKLQKNGVINIRCFMSVSN
ncbi:hypothetical protein KAR28_04150 [Candidatus Parcubacteria bacterium]|nr:hypothetical protein [Candidatus Parcubacteria bacterium]